MPLPIVSHRRPLGRSGVNSGTGRIGLRPEWWRHPTPHRRNLTCNVREMPRHRDITSGNVEARDRHNAVT